MWGLLLNRYTAGALIAVAIFVAGDFGGTYARKYRAIMAAVKVKAVELERQKAAEVARGAKQDARFAEADRAFRARAKSLQPCILTKQTAEALNLITD